MKLFSAATLLLTPIALGAAQKAKSLSVESVRSEMTGRFDILMISPLYFV
jgi:hypothetical protein